MESTNIVDYLYITLKLVQLTMWGKAWPWDAICVEAVRAFTFASWMEATFPFRKCRSKCKIISLALIQDVGWGCLIIARMSVIDKVQTSKDSMESLLCHNIGYNQTPKWKFTPSPLRLHNRFFLHPIFEHMSRESFQLLYLKMRPSFSYPYSIVSLIQKKLKSWRKVGTLSHSSGVPTLVHKAPMERGVNVFELFYLCFFSIQVSHTCQVHLGFLWNFPSFPLHVWLSSCGCWSWCINGLERTWARICSLSMVIAHGLFLPIMRSWISSSPSSLFELTSNIALHSM